MTSGAPTAREIFLLFCLLGLLLLHASWNSGSESHLINASYKPNAAVSNHVPRKRWTPRASALAHTKVVAHVPGWTIFDNIYLVNSTFFAVVDDPKAFPDIQFILSKGLDIRNGKEAEDSRLPTSQELSIISPQDASRIFRGPSQVLDGASFIVNDTPQYMTHYYHFCAELLFGFWRTYTTLEPTLSPNGTSTLPAPSRFLFSRVDADHWRDYAAMNQLILRSSFPASTLSFSHDWQDMASSGQVFRFERAILADRSAGMLGYNYQRTQRTASLPFALPGPPSLDWWLPLRNNVVRMTGIPASTGSGTQSNPVITYISRQDWGRRMLIKEDHEGLVRALYGLRDKYGWEVNVVSMDKMNRQDQIQLAARTTIMMGVHGNGLTSLLWMKPTARSTVMEFFFPGGFAHDYEFTTRALGMVHYGFWGSQSFTSPSTPLPAYPEGFQGNSIPIDGEAVARLCVERLTLSQEFDD